MLSELSGFGGLVVWWFGGIMVSRYHGFLVFQPDRSLLWNGQVLAPC